MFTRNHLVVVALRVNPTGWMFGSIASNTPWEQSILVRLKMILIFSSKALSILVLVQYYCFYINTCILCMPSIIATVMKPMPKAFVNGSGENCRPALKSFK